MLGRNLSNIRELRKVLGITTVADDIWIPRMSDQISQWDELGYKVQMSSQRIEDPELPTFRSVSD